MCLLSMLIKVRCEYWKGFVVHIFEIEIKDYKNNKTASSQSREKQNCKVVYHMKTHI